MFAGTVFEVPCFFQAFVDQGLTTLKTLLYARQRLTPPLRENVQLTVVAAGKFRHDAVSADRRECCY